MDLVVPFAQGMFHYLVKIIRCAAMIKTKLPVHLATTSAKVPANYIEAVIKSCPGHPLHIRSCGVTLQAMRNNNRFFCALTEAIQIEEIIVRSNDSFPLEFYSDPSQ